MKYLVMECRQAYAVVLGDDGIFRKVANMHYEVGQTVSEVVSLKLPEGTKVVSKTNYKGWISALAACFVLVITALFFSGQTAYASVYMTINPEVRIDVNRNDVVVGVEGMNADGTDLLNGYDHRKKNLDTVMDELVNRAIDMGYLHEGGRITLSLDGDEEWIVSHGDRLNQHLNDHLTDKITVTIDIEQKQPEQTTPTTPTATIVIPVNPDNYGDSDYDDDSCDGESNYGSTDGEDSNDGESDHNDEQSNYDDSDSGGTSTDGGDSGYGQTDYDEPEDDGQTDYDDWTEDDGESDYEEQSNYGEAMSDYDEPNGDSQTDLDDSDDADDDYSNYEETDSDYEASDYEDA